MYYYFQIFPKKVVMLLFSKIAEQGNSFKPQKCSKNFARVARKNMGGFYVIFKTVGIYRRSRGLAGKCTGTKQR